MPLLPDPGETFSDELSRSAQSPQVRTPLGKTRSALAAAMAFVILLVVAATYVRIEDELESTLESKLRAILNANVHAAEQWLDEQGALAKNLAIQPEVAQSAARLGGGSSADSDRIAAGDELARHLEPLHQAGLIAGHLVFDRTGVLLWPADHGRGTRPLLSPEILTALQERSSLVLVPSRVDTDAWGGHVAALSAIGSPHHPSAVLALLVDPKSLSRGLQIASWGRSGETFAFDPSGAFLTEPRFGKNLRELGIWPAQDSSSPARVSQPEVDARGRPVIPSPESGPRPLTQMARQATSGHSGADVAGYTGYLGTPVVGAWAWLDEFGFGIATEVARDEAHASISLLRSALLALVALLGMAMLGFLALGRWTLRVREESVLITQRLGRLARSIQPLSAALENDPSAVLLIDSGGTVVYANASTERVLRLRGPLIGQTVDEVFRALHPELQAALDSGQDSIVAQGRESEDETLLVSSRDLRIDGKPHYLYMLRPVTRQVRLQEIEHWRKLIRVLSHELNNSLAPISSLVSSAKKVNEMSCKNEKLEKIFDTISERTAHLVAFLDSYRAVARLPRPSCREVDWDSFLEGLSAQSEFKLTGRAPESPGYFDPIQLERVLINVLKNAVESGGPADKIELRVTDEGDFVRIDVQDRGTGMPEQVLKQAMLPFFSTKEGGTGVGLALSREIIEAHGGDLLLANREGGGLVVSCTLPAAPPPMSMGSLSRLRARPELPPS